MTDSIVWTGIDGTKYAYKVFDLTVSWNDVPGSYIFTKIINGRWQALYIGEAENLRTRLVHSHEKWAPALRLGMTHVHAHTSSTYESVRIEEETNLIRNYNPPLNKERSNPQVQRFGQAQ